MWNRKSRQVTPEREAMYATVCPSVKPASLYTYESITLNGRLDL